MKATERCACGHDYLAHSATPGGVQCLWGHHPLRDKPGWDEYRKNYPPCPCPGFKTAELVR